MSKRFSCSSSALFFLFFSISFTGNAAVLQEKLYSLKIKNTNEFDQRYPPSVVYKKIMSRALSEPQIRPDTEFGVHGMERPFIHSDRDLEKTSKAFELLSRAGVDSLRSSEATWHRVADKNDLPNNFRELDFQLDQAKKYGMTNLFVVGYPPGKFTVSGNKLSAVNPKYYDLYNKYYSNLFTHFKGMGVEYLELGNEVDAGNIWWIKSTPKEYVKEMCILHKMLHDGNLNIKTVAFAATYSRDSHHGNNYGGGRAFLQKSFDLGINNCADFYSLHHFSMTDPDSFPNYMHSAMANNNVRKPLLDTEQLDTSTLNKDKTYPYDIIKIFTRGFFLFNLKRVDYFMAKDYLMGHQFFTMGLFDIDLNPKPRLLAYASAVDALKGRKLISIKTPALNTRLESYLLKNPAGHKFKYTIVIWNNDHNSIGVTGLSGVGAVQRWDLSLKYFSDLSNKIDVDNKPLIIYCDILPDWYLLDKKNIFKTSSNNIQEIPLP